MADFRKIIHLLILLGFVGGFFIFPLVRIILNLIRLGTLKHKAEKFGKVIFLLQSHINRKLMFLGLSTYIIIIFLLCSLSILRKEPLYLLCIIFPTQWPLDFLLTAKRSKYKGFYENGIVSGDFIGWKEISSWKRIDEDKFSFQRKGGLRFDMEISPYQNEAITFLNSIGIAGEN